MQEYASFCRNMFYKRGVIINMNLNFISNTLVEEFYNNVNDDTNNNTTFELWESQRKCINEILNRIKKENDSFGRVAVLGAGNCNDIDLEFLSNEFEDITLFDIDNNALQTSTKKYSIKPNCQIKLVGDIEFTGLRELSFYNEFAKKLEANNSVKKIIKFIRDTVIQMSNVNITNEYDGKFDFVISMPVYTQLCYPLCLYILAEYMENFSASELKKIIDEFNYLAIAASKKYNDFIFKISTTTAKYFILTDVMEFTEETEYLKKLAQVYVLKGDANGLNALMVNHHRLSGSLEGITNINERNTEFQALNSWIWPFSDKKSYLVYGLRAKRKEK